MVVLLLLLPQKNSDYIERKQFFPSQKSAIAREVAKRIPNGASLFIDIGTTPEAVASALLNHERLRIVTNNINAAHLLRQNETFDITMAGAHYVRMAESLVRQRLILFRNSV